MCGVIVLRHLLAAVRNDMSASCDSAPAAWSVETSRKTEHRLTTRVYEFECDHCDDYFWVSMQIRKQFIVSEQ